MLFNLTICYHLYVHHLLTIFTLNFPTLYVPLHIADYTMSFLFTWSLCTTLV